MTTDRYAAWREAADGTPVYSPKLKIVRYARLSCGCTLDLTQSEWEVVLHLPDGEIIPCPKCSDELAYIMATWRPGAFDCEEVGFGD